MINIYSLFGSVIYKLLYLGSSKGLLRNNLFII